MNEWALDYSGWRPEFRVAEEELPGRWDVLAGLIGRSVVGWTVWDPSRQRWYGIGPLVLVADDGTQVEIGWSGGNNLSITVGTVDLTVPPEILGQACAWRPSDPAPVAAVAGRTITGFAAVEMPYFDGGTDLSGELPIDLIKGWSIDGLWIEFGDAGLHVHNGPDDNRYSSTTELEWLAGAIRVHRLG